MDWYDWRLNRLQVNLLGCMAMNSPVDPVPWPNLKESLPRRQTGKCQLRWGLLIVAAGVGCLLLYGLMRKVADFEEARNREAYALLEVARADARFPFDRQEME